MKKNKIIFPLYLTVPVLVYCFVTILPVFFAFYYSFFNWSGGPRMSFIGWDNYVEMAKDATFWQAFWHNVLITFWCSIGQIGLALILALILNSRRIRLKNFHVAVSYFPVILSSVVVGYIWNILYDYNNGLLNAILRILGLEQYIQPWLANTDLALALTIIPLIWQYVGYYMIIILAGIAAIDKSLLEAAEVDGANAWQRLWTITIPLLKNTLIVCITLCISGNMKAFDLIYVMTNGGPGTATNVMALYAYRTSFVHYRMGYGTALSIGILILSMGITLIVRKVLSGKEED